MSGLGKTLPRSIGHNGFMTDAWKQDILGSNFQFRTLSLPDDDEGEVVATLVRHRSPDAKPAPEVETQPGTERRVLLYLHGWNDYFFHGELAEFFTKQGIAFYALDLRKYGRSLRDHQTPGYIEDLETYDEDIALAWAAIERDMAHRFPGAGLRRAIFAHSTGGLISVLWANRYPGRIAALMLNSPWLELQGSSVVREMTSPVVGVVAHRNPKAAFPNIDQGFNYRVVSANADGEWHYNEKWRSNPAWPTRAGWLHAIMRGHARVAAGLNIQAAILNMTSTRTLIQPRWSDDMHRADTVLDVSVVTQRALSLGKVVTVARVEDGQHDLMLSPHPVRDRAMEIVHSWLGYGFPPASGFPEIPEPTEAEPTETELTAPGPEEPAPAQRHIFWGSRKPRAARS